MRAAGLGSNPIATLIIWSKLSGSGLPWRAWRDSHRGPALLAFLTRKSIISDPAPTAGPGHSMNRGSCQALHMFPQSRDTFWAHLTDEGTEAPRGERPHSCSARPRNKNRGAAPRPRVRGPCSPPPSSSKREGGPVPLSPSLSPPREAGVQRPRLRKLGGPIS